MKQITYSPIRKLKLLLVLPLISGVFYAFAAPEYKFVQANTEDQTNQSQGQATNRTSETNANEGKIVKGKVLDEQGKPLKNATIIVSGTTIGTVSDASGNFELKMTDESPLVVSYVGYATRRVKPDFSKEMVIPTNRIVVGIDPDGKTSIVSNPGDFINPPLYVVDGKEMTRREMEEINTDQIDEISVIKNKEFTAKYGEKGKNGVVLITMKKGVSGSKNEPIDVKVTGYANDQKENQPNSGVIIRSAGTDGTPLVIVDGVISSKKAEDIDPETIQSITVLKGEMATQKYGEKGKDGILDITLKKQGEVFVVVEQMPEFPGRLEALKAFVRTNLQYPDAAIKKGLEGKVYVNFMVSKTGAISEVKVAKGVDPLLDNEAVRLVQAMPDWKPGKQHGETVEVMYTIPVEFRLPQKK